MKNSKELAQILIENDTVFKKVQNIIIKRDEIKKQLKNCEYMHWTTNKMRNVLTEKLLSNIEKMNLPRKNFNLLKQNIKEKLDLYLPITFADYRQENKWHNEWSLVDYVYQTSSSLNSNIEYNFNQMILEFKNEFENKISLNQEIAINNPLSEDELSDLEKRIIYAQCGGINNIKDAKIIEKTFATQDQEIREKFLKIGFKEKVKYKDKNFEKSNSELFHFENQNYKLQLTEKVKMMLLPSNYLFHNSDHWNDVIRYIDNKFENENICLILLKKIETIKTMETNVNNFIAELKNERDSLIGKASSVICETIFANAKIEEFYNHCREEILSKVPNLIDLKKLNLELERFIFQSQKICAILPLNLRGMNHELYNELLKNGEIKVIEIKKIEQMEQPTKKNEFKLFKNIKEKTYKSISSFKNQKQPTEDLNIDALNEKISKIAVQDQYLAMSQVVENKKSEISLTEQELEIKKSQGAIPKNVKVNEGTSKTGIEVKPNLKDSSLKLKNLSKELVDNSQKLKQQKEKKQKEKKQKEQEKKQKEKKQKEQEKKQKEKKQKE